MWRPRGALLLYVDDVMVCQIEGGNIFNHVGFNPKTQTRILFRSLVLHFIIVKLQTRVTLLSLLRFILLMFTLIVDRLSHLHLFLLTLRWLCRILL